MVFDPFDLSLEVTPKSIKESLKAKNYSKALIMALKLNENNLITLALESIPYKDSKLIFIYLERLYFIKLLYYLNSS